MRIGIPKNIPIDVRRCLQALASALDESKSPDFASLTLTDLTASSLVGTNASKVLESVTVSTGLNYTRPTLSLSHLGIESLTDPNADRILFWDDSATASKWLTVSTGLQISTTNLTTKDSEIVHDNLSGFVANEHIDWTNATQDLYTTGYVQAEYCRGDGTNGVALYARSGNALRLSNTGNTYYTDIKASGATANVIYTLPVTDGTNGYVLTTNGSGTLTWTEKAGSAGDDTQVQFNDGGALAGDTGFTFNKTTNILYLGLNGTTGGVYLWNQGVLTLGELNTNGTNYVQHTAAAAITTNVAYRWPDDGDNGDVLQTDGSGNLSWAAASGASAMSDLTDVDLTDIANGKILKYNSGTSKWECEDDEEGVGGSGIDAQTRVNILRNAFQLAINGSLSVQYLMDGIVDEFEDQTGVDDDTSTNESYSSTDDYYSPSTSGGSDEYTVLLLHCNGDDGSTTITDSSGSAHEITCVDDAQLDTAQKKFGTASLLFDGTSDRIYAADSADWEFGNGNFTLDFWVRWNGSVSDAMFLDHKHDPVTSNAWELYYQNSVHTVWFEYTTDGSTVKRPTDWSWSPSTDTWYHVAVVRNGTNLNLYIDGSQVGSTYNMGSDTIYNSTTYLVIGGFSGGYVLNGWMDEIRISKGIARWTTEFDVPTEEYGEVTTDDMTLVSEDFTAEAAPDDCTIVVFEEDDDAITENTDLKAYISRDGGTTYTEVALVDEGDYASGKRMLVDDIDISGQPSDTAIKWKITTHNNKNCYIHGVGLLWR